MTAQAILIYGRPKRGKTSNLLAAFPNGLFVGRASAIREVALNELGFEPAIVDEVRTLDHLRDCIMTWMIDGTISQFDALVIDDWSLMADASMVEWDNSPDALNKYGKKNVFYAYSQYKILQTQVLSLCVNAGVHFAICAHEIDPKEGKAGGPAVPSRAQAKSIPAWFDIAARVTKDPQSIDPFNFPVCLRANPWDESWITGDRTGVISPTAPFNIREILRAKRGPIALSRLKGLEWQDGVADYVAKAYSPEGDIAKLVKRATDRSAPDADSLHVRWAIQDGLARYRLQQNKRNVLDVSRAKSVTTPSSIPVPGR